MNDVRNVVFGFAWILAMVVGTLGVLAIGLGTGIAAAHLLHLHGYVVAPVALATLVAFTWVASWTVDTAKRIYERRSNAG